jgi:predicted dehydrogenase
MGRVYAEGITKYGKQMALTCVAGGRHAPALAAEYRVAGDTVGGLLARADVDGVIIATPHSTHRELTLAAAAAGKHVLVEKPMARTVAERDDMIRACSQAGVTFSVIKTLRYRFGMRHAKQLIKLGAIGKVRMMRYSGLYAGYGVPPGHWLYDDAEGGVLLDWGAHCFDLLRWFADSDVSRVSAVFANYAGSAAHEPSAMVQLEFSNGVMAQVWMSFEMPADGVDSGAKVVVVGDKAVIDADAYGDLRIRDVDGWRTVYTYPNPNVSLDPLARPRVEQITGQLQDFADSVREGRQPEVDPRDARAAIAVVEAAYRSWRQGAPVEIDPGF